MCTPVVGNRESLVLKGTVGFYWRKPLFLAKSIKFILPKLPWLLTWFQQAHLRRTTEASQEVDAGPLRVVLTDSRTRPLTPLLPLVRPSVLVAVPPYASHWRDVKMISVARLGTRRHLTGSTDFAAEHQPPSVASHVRLPAHVY